MADIQSPNAVSRRFGEEDAEAGGGAELNLLEVSDLWIEIRTQTRTVLAARGMSFAVRSGQRLGIVGESGSGKSISVLAIAGLLPFSARVTRGSVRFNSTELVGLAEKKMRSIRGQGISIAFQNAGSALNPLVRIGDQVADVVRARRHCSAHEAWDEAVAILASTGIARPAQRAHDYPHQLSGGMAQRVLISVMLACRPQILIADEPTTGLDPLVAVQVLDLLMAKTEDVDATLVLVSHDIASVARTCTDVVVAYAGEVLESGPVDSVLASSASPYTRALIASAELRRVEKEGHFEFVSLPGTVPLLTAEYLGCALSGRCPEEVARKFPTNCRERRPELRRVGPGHLAACHFAEQLHMERDDLADQLG